MLLDLRSKEVLTRHQLNAIEQDKPSTVNIQTKIEERHRQVEENLPCEYSIMFVFY